MGTKSMVICDPEEGYACALAAYMMKRKEFAFQIQICSRLQGVLDIQEKTEIDYIFISSEYGMEERMRVKAAKKLVLTATGHEPITQDEIAVGKYQSGEDILAELVRSLDDQAVTEGIYIGPVKKGSGKLIGVFSPIHRIGKTSYALELGQRLAAKAEVLYLNMEIYGGLGGHFAEDSAQTLADLLYYSRQENSNLYIALTTMVNRSGGLDYIAPMTVSADIKAVTPEEWKCLIAGLMEKSAYDVVILDLDEGIQGLYEVLQMCSEIHMHVSGNQLGLSKIAQFEHELRLLGYEDVLPKIIRREQSV